MSREGSGGPGTLWLWDGETEFEGPLVSADGQGLVARLRRLSPAKRAASSPGRPVLLDWLERQRRFVRRACFGQSAGIGMGALLEVQIESLQPSQDDEFDYVLAGRYWPVADQDLEALSELNTGEAFRYLQSRSSGPRSLDARSLGESALSLAGA